MTNLNSPLGPTSPVAATAAPATQLDTLALDSAPGGNGEVRLSFTSSEVGNGSTLDSNTMANQDGGLAVRAQGEDAAGELTGAVSRFGDEDVLFVGANASVRFDVRDLVSGAARGDDFQAVQLGSSAGERIDRQSEIRSFYINAGMGNDSVLGGSADDFLVGGAGDDALNGGSGNDSFIGGGGSDSITGGFGTDTMIYNVVTDGADRVNLGSSADAVNVGGAGVTQVRLTFTSAEVGNGAAVDGGLLTNQDGGLALRLQAEDGADALTGSLARFDDEGITFVSTTPGLTFDVRDLVSGVGRGDGFEVVQLGTVSADVIDQSAQTRSYYINAGVGDDFVTGGTGRDFLVGGAGNDTLSAGTGNDSFIGGAGDDRIFGGVGRDLMVFNVVTDGADQVNLGPDGDVVNVGGAGVTQVRLTFTSAEVGNANVFDSNTLPNQDGGLALRLQAEDGSDFLTGATSRFDDEGVTFVSTTAGLTFDVRDLVSGVARGDGFEVVQLGTFNADGITAADPLRSYYINTGQGNDTVNGGNANDFLVGGSGNDILRGGQGNDSFIGGGGDDSITGGSGADRAIVNIVADGADAINLGTGLDTVAVAGVGVAQVRLTFTSAEVGNDTGTDSNTLPNQDGGLAVRMQAEDATGELTGGITRVDDEGVTFLSTTPGLTFDVRDLVSGVARGNSFAAVQLGRGGAELIDHSDDVIAYYVNAGMGNDTVLGGTANDFLVGGAGDDALNGGSGNDSFIGGGGNDSITGSFGTDTMIYNVVTDGADRANLGFGADAVNVGGAGVTQVRLTFTSAEIGNGAAVDGGTLTNQDGGLAVRLQAEDGADALTGSLARFDDEGITFVSTTPGLTFDVRDLVSGAARGDTFEVVQLGTVSADVIDHSDDAISYYVNAGMGNDTVTGGSGSDFLVGGAGDDVIRGAEGNDSLLGGGGADTFAFGTVLGSDSIVDFLSGTDVIDLAAFGIAFADVTSTVMGANLRLDVDINGNGDSDFQITLLNVASVVEGDFIF